MQQIIRDNLEKCLSKLTIDNDIVVLKGITNDDIKKVNLQDLFNAGVTKSWFEFYKSGRRIISYEEFLYFYNFIKEEFDNVYIINNNIFHNFYPLNITIPLEIKTKLSDFFDNEADDIVSNVQINDGEKYIRIFSNLKLNSILDDDICFVRYNDETEIEDIKIKTINLFDENNLKGLNIIKNEDLKNVEYIYDIDDYLVFLLNVLNKKETTFSVNIENFSGEKSIIFEKIKLLNTYINPVNIVKVRLAVQDIKTNKRFYEILEEHWGHNSFRNLKVYNVDDLEQGSKTIETITQENIINDIVFQAESVIANPEYDYSDVFVTAPTGSGKSAMFLIPAMYLAEKYNLVTLVISPLIGLMNDQIANLKKTYRYAKTINSDISQIEKEEIMEDIKNGQCHILYLSPESLLARSDISQIIGDRKIGLIVIDEAHIVTTWGKQFRPDYWYLGDYIKKLRKKQKIDHHPFILATFTATAIYGGIEDMYTETLDSLNMRKPITYLGYVKRDDIEIDISELKTVRQKEQYQMDKFENLLNSIQRAVCLNKKILIYFPSVNLIENFYSYCRTKDMDEYIVKYYGPMPGEAKKESANLFKTKEKLVMLATKAFGMGIDISDIEIVCHFAPTGNVCDYVQEIGRAARDPKLKGEAVYSHMKNDFQHINRLHGLSTVKKYQLVNVIKKVYELFKIKLETEQNTGAHLSKKRNEMLVDAENFTYIFEGPRKSSQDDLIAKVKTALLLIQKDYTSKMGFSPFAMRPSTLFAQGYFQIPDEVINSLKSRYGYGSFTECSSAERIYLVNLQNIWEKDYGKNLSFPNFKYLLYTGAKEIENYNLNKMIPATRIEIEDCKTETAVKIQNAINYIIRKSIDEGIYLEVESKKKMKNPAKNISDYISTWAGISSFKADAIANILISTIKNYARNYNKTMNAEVIKPKPLRDGSETYTFNRAAENFIRWIETMKKFIKQNAKDNVLYIVKGSCEKTREEIITALGFLEAIGYMNFNASGGLNSQIYIYINQTKTMEEVIRKPMLYNNRLLEKVAERHKISVAMMTYLYQNNFESNVIWEYIEDYFLGKIPDAIVS